jgi:hypothetical protein
MKWCCSGFQSSYENAGQRGTAFLIGRDSLGKPDFVFQFRAVEIDKEFPFPKTEIPISTVSDIRINFCPTCGSNLEKWYGKYVDSLYRKGLRVLEL